MYDGSFPPVNVVNDSSNWMVEVIGTTTTTTSTPDTYSPDSVLFGLGIFSVATVMSFLIGLVLKTRLNADLKSVRNSRFKLVQNVRLARLQYKNRDPKIPAQYKEKDGMFNKLDPLDYCKYGRLIDQDVMDVPDHDNVLMGYRHFQGVDDWVLTSRDCDVPSSLKTDHSSIDDVGIFETSRSGPDMIAYMKSPTRPSHEELFEATKINPNVARNRHNLPPTVYYELSKLLSVELCRELDILKDPLTIQPKRKLYGGTLALFEDLELDNSDCQISYGLIRCEKAFRVLNLDYAVLRSGQSPSPALLRELRPNKEFTRDCQEYVSQLRAEVKRFSRAMNILKNDMNEELTEIIRPHVQRCYILKKNIDVIYKALTEVSGSQSFALMSDKDKSSSNFYDLYLRPRDELKIHDASNKSHLSDVERGGK